MDKTDKVLKQFGKSEMATVVPIGSDVIIPNYSGLKTPSHTIAGVTITPTTGATLISNDAGIVIGGTSYNSNYIMIGGSNMITITANGIGIGRPSSSPNSKAMLDVVSTTKGILIPRMTTAQKNAIASPPEGLEVYDTDLHKKCVYTGAAWETITSA